MSTEFKPNYTDKEHQDPKKNLFKRIFKFLMFFFLFSGILLSVISYVVSKVYKAEIKSFVITKVEEAIKADIGVGKIELSIIEKFPKVSLSFSNFEVVSSFEKHKDTLVSGEKLFFEFDILDVLQHNYQITSLSFEEAVINFKINHQGVSNFDIFKTQSNSDSSSSILLSLQNFEFKNINIFYQDDTQNIYFNTTLNEAKFKGDFTDVNLELDVYNDFYLHKLSSNEFILEDKKIVYNGVISIDKIHKTCHLSDNQLSASGLSFMINGDVDYSFQEKINLNVSCSSNHINISDLAKIDQEFYSQYISEYNPKGFLDLDALLVGFASSTELPTLNLGFKIDDAAFTLLDMPFDNLKLKGVLQLDENIKEVKILSSKMQLYNDVVNLNGVYSFKNVKKIHFNVKTNLSALSTSTIVNNTFNDSLHYSFDGNTLMNFKGDLNLYDNTKVRFSSLNGELKFKNGLFKFYDENEEIYVDSLNVDFIDNDKIQCNLMSSYKNEKLTSVVEIGNLLSFLNGESSSLTSQASFTLDKYLVPESNNDNVSDKKIALPDFIFSNIDVNINQIIYASALVENFSLQSKISPNRIDILNYKFNVFDGIVHGNAKINQSSVKVYAKVSDVDFQTLFKAFDNFDQTNIQSEHITGLCNLTLNSKFPLNAVDFDNDLFLEGDFVIKDGELNNVPIVNDIVSYLDKNLVTKSVLDMKRLKLVSKHISFNEIKNTFSIINGNLIIPDFTIKSSVLDVNLDGVQKLSGYFRYNMNFRLAEIVNNSQSDDKFGVVEDDGTGMRVFMKIFGTSDNINYEVDKEAKKNFTKNKKQSEKKELLKILKNELPFFKKNKSDASTIDKSSSDDVEFEIEEEEKEMIDLDKNEEDKDLKDDNEDATIFEIEQ